MKKALRASTAFSLAALLTISPLMSPVAAAYAANSVQAEDISSDAVSADDGVASRDEGVADGDMDVEQSLPTDVDEPADEDFGVDASSTEPQTESADSPFQYIYLAYPNLISGTDQVVAFATPNDSDTIASATLNYVSANGVQGAVDASAQDANSAAFTFGSELELNTYFLTSITYVLQGDGTEHEINLSDRDYSFTVVDGTANCEGTSVYYADGDGNAVEAQSIKQALECADSPDGISTYAARSARKNVRIIALDAGHGGTDPGAQGNGKSEADLTWKIVAACKNKLEAYGFKVVLAREQSGGYSGNDYLYRVQRCVSQGAQAFVSFHINSGSPVAHGAEVYAPTANEYDYTQVSVELANKVMNNLASMGLSYRGVFQMEVGDEFAVIRCAREQGIPGILIEHGFISDAGDVLNYFSDEGCRRLGEADADAIIAQFPKSTWLDYSSVFDANYYLSNNPDVAKATAGNSELALDHFINYGMSEGRRGSASFDVQSYFNEYPDLRAAFGFDLVKYYEHYVTAGKAEGRHGTGCSKIEGYATTINGVDYSSVYDPSFYLSNNEDIRNAFSKRSPAGVVMIDDAAVLRHFVSCGMAEGRRGSESFDVLSYYNRYPDLRRAFGANLTALYGHYLSSGRAEGRIATGCASLAGAVASQGGTDYSPVYDFDFYTSNNGDVLSAFTTVKGGLRFVDDAAVLRHFVSCGMAEGRRGSESFDVYGYRNRYADLRKAFGQNLKSYYIHYLNCGIKEGRNGASATGYEGFIMSSAYSTYLDAADHFTKTVGPKGFPSAVYTDRGASNIIDFCKILYEEAQSEGVSPEVLYGQVMKETGYLKFGNLVQPNQCNFGGLGATGPGNPGYTFGSVREGLRAQVQHLKAYGSTEPLINPCIDARFKYVSRGCAPRTVDLNGKWAVPGVGYGESIDAIAKEVIG
ncbi:N-acetylmuramoyl-L-alanine amidase family protein [Collinsella aerofaciens]|uniref:N-acetylmuramoyl-L-alanine amidase family protein n=1 Tax=Collinsella aerofaciens TaxID=74426 RepID=UPI00232B6958|nr:N-acetylmuramoyl-L-alanine amidase [Collinsella aerofaciens]MDB1899702.1 N-acetylmuramoyl-L-alanine amidase [Collinsella aerofaciens]